MIKYSPYDLLNVEPGTNSRQLKKQYKRLIRQFTPEHHPEEFMEIRNAYENLTQQKEKEFELGVEYPKTFPLYKSVGTYFEETDSEGLEHDKIISVLTTIFETPFDTQEEVLTFLENDKPKF